MRGCDYNTNFSDAGLIIFVRKDKKTNKYYFNQIKKKASGGEGCNSNCCWYKGNLAAL